MNTQTLIGKGITWFSYLAIIAVGTILWASDGGLLSKQELKDLVANAKNARDHERLAQHFEAKAVELEAESMEHQQLAAKYKANPTMHESKHPMSGETAGHCQYFADDLKKAAGRARQIAADHREMAKTVSK